MTAWERWLQRPQSLWARRALAQVHLWLGLGIGLYVVLISVSGSAIVFRRELAKRFSRRTLVVAQSKRRMSLDELQRDVHRNYPAYEVYGIYESERPDAPDQVVLGDGRNRIARLFDPYTGADLGGTESVAARALGWLADLHDNLLSGMTGRFVNGIGAFFLTMLSLTGIVIWWPGVKSWRRSLRVNRKARFARFNWDLHSAIGFWCSSFVLLWGISGICLCFPGVLDSVISSQAISWLTRLHFGRFGRLTEALWTILGLAPAALAITGAIMWWNRVLRKRFTSLRPSHASAETHLPLSKSAAWASSPRSRQ